MNEQNEEGNLKKLNNNEKFGWHGLIVSQDGKVLSMLTGGDTLFPPSTWLLFLFQRATTDDGYIIIRNVVCFWLKMDKETKLKLGSNEFCSQDVVPLIKQSLIPNQQ